MDNKYIDLMKKILVDSEELLAHNTDETGNIIIDKTTLRSMTDVLQAGLLIYNQIVKEGLYKDNKAIQETLLQINNIADKLNITDENAKNLNMRDAMINWTKAQGLIISLCVMVLNEENISL